MESRRMIGIGALYLGSCMAMGCWYSLRRVRRWLATSTVTEGRITGVRKGPLDTDYNRQTYALSVAFHTQSGRPVDFITNIGTNRRGYTIGQSITVRYQSSQPDDARINDLSGIWLAPVVTGSLSFWALLAGCILTFTTIDL